MLSDRQIRLSLGLTIQPMSPKAFRGRSEGLARVQTIDPGPSRRDIGLSDMSSHLLSALHTTDETSCLLIQRPC